MKSSKFLNKVVDGTIKCGKMIIVMNDLLRILDTMDVPPLRKTDVGWLKRNLAIRNRSHPEFHRAMTIIHDLTKRKIDKSDGDDNMNLVR